MIADQPHLLIYVGLLLLASQGGGWIANLLGAPRVIGYLASGLLLGPSTFGVMSHELVNRDLSLVTDIALAVIAFAIGGSLELSKLQRLGVAIFAVAVAQAVAAMLVAGAAMCVVLPIAFPEAVFWPISFSVALVIGAVSAATAPAAIVSIVREYRARGPFTTTLLGVVAIDDALTILLFAIAVNISTALTASGVISWQAMLIAPCIHLMVAFAVGGVVAWIVHQASGFFTHRVSVLANTLGAILLTAGISITYSSSPLLACMVLGFLTVNFVDQQQDAFFAIDQIEEPLFGMFFAVAGAHVDLNLLRVGEWLALIIVFSRFAGKLIGCRVVAWVIDTDPAVKNNLGLALLPTAGVTVGLILEAKGLFVDNQVTQVAFNAVLASVLVNELISPFLVRIALVRSGEATSGDLAAKEDVRQ